MATRPRPASTVVVVREGPARDDPLEFLLLRRSAASRFAPGFVVFPGGTMEPADRRLAERWFGSGDDQAVARACAIRELAEEAGLALTRHGLVEAAGRLPGDGGLKPPFAETLAPISRWVAPEFLPVRYDARFFALAAPRGLIATPDGLEVDRAWWAPAAAALEAAAAGSGPLMWPTLRMLEALAGCASSGDVLRLRVAQVEPPMARRVPSP